MLLLLVGCAAPEASTPPTVVSPAASDPLWPQQTFLAAGSLRTEGRSREAAALDRRLAEWAAADPLGDGLGGSALAIVSLWRWLEAAHTAQGVEPEELTALLETTEELRNSHLSQRMFRFSFLDALPELERRIVRRMSTICWRAGRLEPARNLFLDFLRLAPNAELEPVEEAMLAALIENGATSPETILEYRAQRLEQLRRYEGAIELWRQLTDSDDTDRRALARLRVARLEARLFRGDRSERARLLGEVITNAKDPSSIQEALLARASVWSREGSGQRIERFRGDLTTLIERYPSGEWTDDALYRLAGHHQRLYEGRGLATDLDRALELYAQLQAFEGDNNWSSSAYFQPAMTLYSRGGPGDLRRARALFEQLVERQPEGPLRRSAEFWRARILEESGHGDAAQVAFEQLASERPYDYYGLRARMHLEAGPDAARRLWPDRATRSRLAADAGVPPPEMNGTTPYHRRLRAAIDSGLYRRLLEARRKLRGSFPGTRLQNLSLQELDRAGAIDDIALLLALRQDALAAAARPTAVDNVLEVLSALGTRAGDLPLAMSMAIGRQGGELVHGVSADPRFLGAAYPQALTDTFRRAAKAEQIPPELLYALSRRESLFDPAAISSYSARGLFQFIPDTFEALDERWDLLARSGVQDRDRYLLDPELNAALGARWLADELIHRQNCVLLKELDRSCNSANRRDERLALVTRDRWFDDRLSPRQQRVVMLALMEHSRGYGAVRGWLDRWRALDRAEDFEYMIETAGAAETRILVRGVLTDAALVAAIGRFETGKSRPGAGGPTG